MIEAGLVLVNGRVARASRRLRGGDTVRLELPPPEAGIPAIEPEDLPLTRVFEDEWLLVIDKPAGMVVHPGAGVRSGTPNRFSRLDGVGDGFRTRDFRSHSPALYP